MSPDLYFALTLFVRMGVTAAFLIAATVTAERSGPLIGGLVATLPISAGPIYIFLAIDHGAQFIGQSALGSLIGNAFNIAFAVSYCLLAQKRSLLVCLAGAFAVWTFLSWIVTQAHPGLWGALGINVVALAIGLWLSSSLRHVQFPRMRTYWYDYALRAAMVATLVGVVVALSYRIGATASGNLAVFPIVLSSIAIILHPRVGGPATAAVLSNAVIGLGGFGVATLALNLMAEPFGAALSLSLTLAISVGINVLIFYARRRMKPA